MPGKRRTHSISSQLLGKSREAALTAVQAFNNPLIGFKSETFVVLMIIAWTYMLHAYYRTNRVEYRYWKPSKSGKRRIFDRTKHGAYKHWELERCLNDSNCPIDAATSSNLRFLIRLRNEIEHEMSLGLDSYLSGRYQACALNYCHYVEKLFGRKHSMQDQLAYSIQFVQLTRDQVAGMAAQDTVPERLRAFIADFDGALKDDEFNSEQYSYRLLFTRKQANRRGQADSVIEFIDPHSELGEDIQTQYWFKKEVERPKFLPSQVVTMMQSEGFTEFGIQHYTRLWQAADGKNPGKGLGVRLGTTWYWYESWTEVVRQHCQENRDVYVRT